MRNPEGARERPGGPGSAAEGLSAFRWEEDWVSLLLILLLCFEHLAFGANRADLSIAFAFAHAALLGAALLFPWARDALRALKGWPAAAGLFLLVLFAAAAALVPLPFGAHPQGGLFALRGTAAVYPFGVVVELAKLLGFACLFTLAGVITQDRRRAYQLMALLLVSAAAFALICLVLNALSPDQVLSWRKPMITRGRLSGVFSSPNTAATVFGVNALLGVGGLLASSLSSTRAQAGGAASSKSPPRASKAPNALLRDAIALAANAPLAVASFFFSLLCLVETGSRGGMTAFALAAAVLGVIWARDGRRFDLRLLALLAGPALLAAALGAGAALGRLKTAEFSHDLRIIWAASAWRIFTAAPVLGFGLGSLPMMFSATETQASFRVVNLAGSAHNVYLQWLAEGGLLASIPMAALLGLILAAMAFGGRPQGRAAVWRRVLLCAALLVLGHSVLEYSLQEPSIAAYFALILGAGFGLSAPGKGEKEALASRAAAKGAGARR